MTTLIVFLQILFYYTVFVGCYCCCVTNGMDSPSMIVNNNNKLHNNNHKHGQKQSNTFALIMAFEISSIPSQTRKIQHQQLRQLSQQIATPRIIRKRNHNNVVLMDHPTMKQKQHQQCRSALFIKKCDHDHCYRQRLSPLFPMTLSTSSSCLLLSSYTDSTFRSNPILSSNDTTTTTSISDGGETNNNDFIFQYGWVAEKTRPDFPLLFRHNTEEKPYIYFDNAATSQKPDSVIDSMNQYYQEYNANVHRGAHKISRQATEAYEISRQKIQYFVGAAHRSEIIFTSGATDAMNCIVQSYAKYHINHDDDIILLTVAEHHSNIVPWQMLIEEKKHHHPHSNVQIRYIPIDKEKGCLDIEEMKHMLLQYGSRIKIASFQHVSNVLGCINPVKEMIGMIHTYCPNAITILDACQSLPHMKIDVRDMDIDFLVGSGHKMCGPTGIGFLYGKLSLLNSNMMRPYKGGGEMIDIVTLAYSNYQTSPAKYEAGTPPIAQAIGLGYAIDYLTKIGMDHIEAYIHELGMYLYEQIRYHIPELIILGPKPDHNDTVRASLCAFYHPTIHASDLATLLDSQSNIAIRVGHHCCQPLHNEIYEITQTARASLYFYNTKQEIDSFIHELKETIEFFTDIMPLDSDNNHNHNNTFVPFI